MKPKWLLLAADLLELASNKFSNHSCNYWPIPDGWTQDDVMEFGRAFEDYNSDGVDFDPENPWPPDFAAMDFLADKLREMAGK